MNLFVQSIKWLISKLFPQKNKPLPQEGKEYQFIEVPFGGESVSAIKIIDGPYSGVIYSYGRVKVLQPDDPTSPAVLSFDFHSHTIPPGVTPQNLASVEFKQIAGDILVSLILDNDGKGEYATIREHYPEESDL